VKGPLQYRKENGAGLTSPVSGFLLFTLYYSPQRANYAVKSCPAIKSCAEG
jgi:hypothetical protein